MIARQTSAVEKQILQRFRLEMQLQQDISKLESKALSDRLSDAEKEELKNKRKSLLRLSKVEGEDRKRATAAFKKSLEAAQTYELNFYKKLSVEKRKEYDKSTRAELDSERKLLKEKEQMLLAQIATETDQKKKTKLQKDLSEITSAKKQATDNIMSIDKRTKKGFSDASHEDANKRAESAKATKAEAKANIDRIVSSEKYIKIQQRIDQATAAGDRKKLNRAKSDLERFKKLEGYYASEADLEEANHELEMAHQEEVAATTKDNLNNLKNAGKKLLSNAIDSIDGNLDAMFGSQGKMMGRLQGTAIDWADTVDSVSDTIGLSGVVSKKSVVAKMVELVDSGVAYNLEMRAFLAETSQNIAATFDATNGTLLRLIRLQQADSTAARLGMEASLTKLFNQYFEDTSYLAQDVSQSVSDAILDASATMSKEDALAFEYNIQKWLGALYSIGASSDVVSSIAQGINYMGSGNLTAITGNTGLQNLFSLSAARAGGKSFANMLQGGLTADDTNKLLKAMVELLGDIASSQNNYVTKSAYAELFGMSTTDLSTFASLTTKEIENLFNTTESYSSLMSETKTQLDEVSNRINISTLVDTAIDNALVGAATNIGSNAFTYGTWKALGILKDTVGEIRIPGITAFGTGIASGLDLLNIARTGMVGFSLLGELIGGIGSMFSGGPTKLENWNFDPTTTRGGGLKPLSVGSFSNTSYSAMLGTGSSSGADAEAASMASGEKAAEEAGGTSSDEMKEQKEIPQKIYDAIAGEDTVTVLSLLQEIDDRLDPSRVFYTAVAGTLTSDAAEKVFRLSAEVSASKSSVSQIPQTTTEQSLKELRTAVSNIGIGGSGLAKNESSYSELQSVIEAAILSALRDASAQTSVGITGVAGSIPT